MEDQLIKFQRNKDSMGELGEEAFVCHLAKNQAAIFMCHEGINGVKFEDTS